MTANSGSAGRGKEFMIKSENPCPSCGKKKWKLWNCHENNWTESKDIDDIPIVDWTTGWEMFYIDGTHVDICLFCGAQVQG